MRGDRPRKEATGFHLTQRLQAIRIPVRETRGLRGF